VTVDARFCPRCGQPLPNRPPTACAACGYAIWINPRPTGTVVIVDSGRFLALKRVREPRAGYWDLPGGFCDGFELPAEAAVREAREELNLTVTLDGFIGMYVGRYTYQGETLPVLDCFWFASIVDGELRIDPDEASAHTWLPLADPPELAFATMDLAIADARMRLESRTAGK
jgi:8-oxo-dGTP diphosphatase